MMSKQYALLVSGLVLMASVVQTYAVNFHDALKQGFYPTYYVVAGLESTSESQVNKALVGEEMLELKSARLNELLRALQGMDVYVVELQNPSNFIKGTIDKVTLLPGDINAPNGDLNLTIKTPEQKTLKIRFIANSGSVLINYTKLAKKLNVKAEALENVITKEVLSQI